MSARRGWLAALLLTPLLALGSGAGAEDTPDQERIVAGLSNSSIGINAAFNGSEVLIYGAVRRQAPEPTKGKLDVIVTLEGPSQQLTVRKKSREWGIWLNTSKVRIASAPSYYAVATTAPLKEILPQATDTTYRISPPLALRAFAGPLEVPDAAPYTEAMIRIREKDGLYSVSEGAVRLVEDTLFRADFALPANLVEGDYKTRIFLLRDGQVTDSYQTFLSVRRIGLERWLYAMSQNQPTIYGLLSLILAGFAGWAAAALFRFIRS